MIFGLFKTMYFFILHFEVRNLGFIDIEDKGGYLNIIDEDGIITTLMGEEREKFLFCLSTYKHIFDKI